MANEKRLIDANALCEFFRVRYEFLRNASERRLPNGYVEVDTDIQTGAIIAKEFLDKAKDAPTVDAVPVETVVEMFEYFLGDCPCNYSSTDGWLPEVCELQEECPNPKDKFGCWKQFIKHWGERREGE